MAPPRPWQTSAAASPSAAPTSPTSSPRPSNAGRASSHGLGPSRHRTLRIHPRRLTPDQAPMRASFTRRLSASAAPGLSACTPLNCHLDRSAAQRPAVAPAPRAPLSSKLTATTDADRRAQPNVQHHAATLYPQPATRNPQPATRQPATRNPLNARLRPNPPQRPRAEGPPYLAWGNAPGPPAKPSKAG